VGSISALVTAKLTATAVDSSDRGRISMGIACGNEGLKRLRASSATHCQALSLRVYGVVNAATGQHRYLRECCR
jgi:hypothetical protein